MVNDTCPLSGNAVSSKFTVAYDGQEIGFCSEEHARDAAKIIARLPVKSFWRKHLNLSSGVAFAVGGVVSALLW